MPLIVQHPTGTLVPIPPEIEAAGASAIEQYVQDAAPGPVDEIVTLDDTTTRRRKDRAPTPQE